MRRPCSGCELDANLPNVGTSHGFCLRHYTSQRIKLSQYLVSMGRPALPPQEPSPDVSIDIEKTLTPREIELLINVYALLRAKDLGKKFKK